jgi:hypothetical protein
MLYNAGNLVYDCLRYSKAIEGRQWFVANGLRIDRPSRRLCFQFMEEKVPEIYKAPSVLVSHGFDIRRMVADRLAHLYSLLCCLSFAMLRSASVYSQVSSDRHKSPSSPRIYIARLLFV